MRVKRLTLLSAVSLLVLPLSAIAQTSPQPGRSPVTASTAAVTLSGRYLAARVAEQDHDYENGAAQLDPALVQNPNDADLIYAAFRLRLYAGRFDAAVLLAPSVLQAKPGDGFANLVLAVQQIKKGDYRGAETQLGRIGSENRR